MAYHVTVEQMRMIQWARSWDWAIRFMDTDPYSKFPAEFQQWFPATDVTYQMANLESMIIQAGLTEISFPYTTPMKTVNMTIVDGGSIVRPHQNQSWGHRSVLALHKWLNYWFFSITNHYLGTACLANACKHLVIYHLSPGDKLIGARSYAVFPQGEVSFNGGSGGDPSTLEATFVIAGHVKTNLTQNSPFHSYWL